MGNISLMNTFEIYGYDSINSGEVTRYKYYIMSYLLKNIKSGVRKGKNNLR